MPGIPEKLPNTIRNLIDLSNSPYRSEARSAAEKINYLLSKYETTLEELGIGTSTDLDVPARTDREAGPWQERLLKLIARASGLEVHILTDTPGESYRFTGPKALLSTIQGLYQYIEIKLLELSSQFESCVSDKESFRLGLLDSIEPNLVVIPPKNVRRHK